MQEDVEEVKVSGMEGVHMPPLSVPEQSARPLEEEEPAAVSSKELGEWLRQHPTYTMDMTAFTPVSSCHNCRVKTKAICKSGHMYLINLLGLTDWETEAGL